jgi:hypothetical protein
MRRLADETYVHVGFWRSAQVATYADRMQPVQTSAAASQLAFRIARRWSAGPDGETAHVNRASYLPHAVSPDATKTAASSAIRTSGASNLTLQQPPMRAPNVL